MSNPPPVTVTFLFTDIEGSTKRWEQYPQAMQAADHSPIRCWLTMCSGRIVRFTLAWAH